MKKKKDIICISRTTWEGDYMKAVVHMMGHLAANHRVLFVDYAFTFKDLLLGILGQSNIPIKRILGLQPRLREIKYKGQRLHHLTLPPTLPINWIKSEWGFNRLMKLQTKLIIGPSIKTALKKLMFVRPTMINAFNPTQGPDLQASLDASHTVYYCYDEISASGWGGVHGKRYEEHFARSVDQIIVSSSALLTAKSKLNENTCLVKNGVDFELFNQSINAKSTSIRPEIGYLGSIDFRIDYDLMEEVIISLPDFDFTFVGRITDDKGHARLKSHANAKFTGAQPPDQLPVLMAKMKVAIIPFVKNEFTRNIYPLKINEYLASGLNVVSTDFAELSDFSSLISIVNKASEFADSIRYSITHPKTNQAQKLAMAKNNDWSGRAMQFDHALSSLNS